MNKRDLCRFRAFVGNRMYYNVESPNTTELGDKDIGSPVPFDEIFLYPDSIIMQCSGFRDSKGDLIYEGDVVQAQVGVLILFGLIVYFGETDTHIGFKMAELDDDVWDDFIFEDYDTITVIGNIFETEEYKHLQEDFLENYYGDNNELND